MFTKIKTSEELAAQRESGRMLASVLDTLEAKLSPGMTEKQLAELAASELKALGGQPTFKGYQGFPDVICISTNDRVVHGIPSDYELKEGDIISLDFGVTYRGMVTDSARTLPVGKVDARLAKLIDVTRQSLEAGVASLHDGVQVGDIASAVEAVINHHGYGIVRELVGHGVGHQLHERPDIPNYGRAGTGPELKAGMTIAIEPMVNLGGDAIAVENDGWTITTRDHSPSAHFEHTVLITQDGAEVLTASRLSTDR